MRATKQGVDVSSTDGLWHPFHLFLKAHSSQYRARDRVTSRARRAHGCMPFMASPMLPRARYFGSATRCCIYCIAPMSHTLQVSKEGLWLHTACRQLQVPPDDSNHPPACMATSGYVPTAIAVQFCPARSFKEVQKFFGEHSDMIHIQRPTCNHHGLIGPVLEKSPEVDGCLALDSRAGNCRMLVWMSADPLKVVIITHVLCHLLTRLHLARIYTTPWFSLQAS